MLPDWLIVYLLPLLPLLTLAGVAYLCVARIRKRHYGDFMERKRKRDDQMEKKPTYKRINKTEVRYSQLSRQQKEALITKVQNMCLSEMWPDIASQALQEVNPRCLVHDVTEEVGICYASDVHLVFLQANKLFAKQMPSIYTANVAEN